MTLKKTPDALNAAAYRGQNAIHQIGRALLAQSRADHLWGFKQRFWTWQADDAEAEAVRYARGAFRALAGWSHLK